MLPAPGQPRRLSHVIESPFLRESYRLRAGLGVKTSSLSTRLEHLVNQALVMVQHHMALDF